MRCSRNCCFVCPLGPCTLLKAAQGSTFYIHSKAAVTRCSATSTTQRSTQSTTAALSRSVCLLAWVWARKSASRFPIQDQTGSSGNRWVNSSWTPPLQQNVWGCAEVFHSEGNFFQEVKDGRADLSDHVYSCLWKRRVQQPLLEELGRLCRGIRLVANGLCKNC